VDQTCPAKPFLAHHVPHDVNRAVEVINHFL
jgi:hypothetical protein